jgi:hypothetical protein
VYITGQPAQFILCLIAVQNLLCWLACYVLIGPPSLKYQYSLVESLQSHMILTMSHWSSGLPVCFPSQGTQDQIPWGDLCETGILLLAMSLHSRHFLSRSLFSLDLTPAGREIHSPTPEGVGNQRVTPSGRSNQSIIHQECCNQILTSGGRINQSLTLARRSNKFIPRQEEVVQ